MLPGFNIEELVGGLIAPYLPKNASSKLNERNIATLPPLRL